jgi:hypothetical protein
MVAEFYNRGRTDCLRRLPANPKASNPIEYNDYMNGYNSVQQHGQDYNETFEGICEIIRRMQNLEQIKDLTLKLTDLLISSLHEPADVKTDLDDKFKEYLKELGTYDSKFELRITELYNAVQKSKLFGNPNLTKLKQLRKDAPDTMIKKGRQK